jgi:hypothetical protein
VTLELQAEEIIQTILSGTDPAAAPARHRLRSLLAVHPDDHITVLRDHLIQARAPLPPPPDLPAVKQHPETGPPFPATTDGAQS